MTISINRWRPAHIFKKVSVRAFVKGKRFDIGQSGSGKTFFLQMLLGACSNCLKRVFMLRMEKMLAKSYRLETKGFKGTGIWESGLFREVLFLLIPDSQGNVCVPLGMYLPNIQIR